MNTLVLIPVSLFVLLTSKESEEMKKRNPCLRVEEYGLLRVLLFHDPRHSIEGPTPPIAPLLSVFPRSHIVVYSVFRVNFRPGPQYFTAVVEHIIAGVDSF